MKILVIGSGAREDALSWRLAQSASCEAIFATPGNAGTASRGENWDIGATDGKNIAARAVRDKIDLAVVGPDAAVAAGVGDQLREAGIATFGPNRSAGRLESSKVFSKRFMERHGIPTARAAIVHSQAAAMKALDDWEGACVIKADGLAAGKGVVVAPDPTAARALVYDWYSHNRIPGGGSELLLEEKLEGRELSVFAIADGRSMQIFGSACDYKRAGDGDTGPNTGGMGAYSPPEAFPENFETVVYDRIVTPVTRGLRAEGETYIGVLYCGVMWTSDGPHVIEFNARFGDPETQVLMPRVEGDFAQLLKSAADGKLPANVAPLRPGACVGVVLATADYPRSSTAVEGLPADAALGDDLQVFWGSSTRHDNLVKSSGGRVLTVTACGSDVAQARERAYDGVRRLATRIGGAFNLTYRTDIGTITGQVIA